MAWFYFIQFIRRNSAEIGDMNNVNLTFFCNLIFVYRAVIQF